MDKKDMDMPAMGQAPAMIKPGVMLRDVVIERILDAPRERVWKTLTEPECVKLWWGPEHFSAPVIQIDLRVGGKYLSCMRSPEGEDFWNTGEFREIIPMEKIVYVDSFADEHGAKVPATYYNMSAEIPMETTVTMTLEDLGGKRTRLTLCHLGMPAGEMLDMTEAGWKTSLDRTRREPEVEPRAGRGIHGRVHARL